MLDTGEVRIRTSRRIAGSLDDSDDTLEVSETIEVCCTISSYVGSIIATNYDTYLSLTTPPMPIVSFFFSFL